MTSTEFTATMTSLHKRVFYAGTYLHPAYFEKTVIPEEIQVSSTNTGVFSIPLGSKNIKIKMDGFSAGPRTLRTGYSFYLCFTGYDEAGSVVQEVHLDNTMSYNGEPISFEENVVALDTVSKVSLSLRTPGPNGSSGGGRYVEIGEWTMTFT